MATLNQDDNQIPTSAEYGDPGTPVASANEWAHWEMLADGGHVTFGKKADAAVTNPATAATLMANIRGMLTHLATMITSLGNIDTDTTSIITQLSTGASALLKAEDAAHASGDAGVQILGVHNTSATASGTVDGDYATISLDPLRRVRVLVKRDITDTLSKAVNTALANSLVVKASAGTLHSIVGYVASGENGWIQMHDATSAPSDTAVPKWSYFVGAATDSQPVNIPLPGDATSTGITLVWSTTGPTKTAGASKMMVAAYYE